MRRTLVFAFAMVFMAAGMLAGPVVAAPVGGTNELYTTDADFDQGALVDVNHDAPNNDQLQLSKTSVAFPFVNVAASARGTAIRINTDTGQIVGEYRTAPNGRARNPSRTTVDRFGNVWVTNRDESAGGRGSVARIGLVTGGTRSDASGTPDAAGGYLAPPFAYNTCVDRDGDGLLRTSQGLADILAWTNTAGADNNGGVSTAEDECVINYTRTAGTNARTVAVDANNDVWVGGANTAHEKLDGMSGQPVAGTQFALGCGGYGGLIDPAGTLWSARYGNGLLRYQPATATGACRGNSTGNYGLGLDPNTGHVWHSSLGGNNRLFELDSAGNVVNSYAQPFPAQGVVVDANSHVWMAELFGSRVWHLAPDPANPGSHYPVGIVTGLQGVTGLAVDQAGKIWAPEINGNRASRIDPDPAAQAPDANGNKVGAIDLSVSLGAGASPYNYSDMTGSVLGEVTAPQGTWTVVQDAGSAGAPWGTVTWNTEPQGSEPAGTSITVEVRTAETEAGLAAAAFVPVSNGAAFNQTGRYIEVRATLAPAPDGTSPVLSDLRVQVNNQPPDCSAAAPSVASIWPPNHKFVPVSVRGVTDPDGDAVSVTIDSIRQDEPVDTTGDGAFAPDGQGIGTDTAEVRAERTGSPQVPGDGRFYHIGFTADDGAGGTCTGTVRVSVPHDRSKPPVDGGPVYDSTANA